MNSPEGRFVEIEGDRYYAITDVDQMPPFFMSLVSASELWMFLSSTGGLTAGRVQPEQAIFPYLPVDLIHLAAADTGSRTLITVETSTGPRQWEPFNLEQSDRYETRRTLYKNTLGNRVIFEEENLSLQLRFSYAWGAAGEFGFVRTSRLENLGAAREVNVFDGVQNLLPAGTPRALQTTSSALVDAYKWNEIDPASGLATYALYAQISDQAEPSESLIATTAFSLGLRTARVCIAASDFLTTRAGRAVPADTVRRGTRGAYFLKAAFSMAAEATQSWQIVVNTGQSQAEVVALRKALQAPDTVAEQVGTALADDHAALRELIGRADGFQCVADPRIASHHTANVLFNIMRGGVFPTQYTIERDDFAANLQVRNSPVHARHAPWLASLPARIGLEDLSAAASAQGDPQLSRLLMEYLPLVFSRRHGDPSRPWNHFAIRLKDANGQRRLAYQGNWRDIFQNWEALLLSYPAYAENMIAKFVNASTLDGHNPYRISQDGIDWEEHDPEDPWSNIGYWGDHQINYLLRLLEVCVRHYPERLRRRLNQRLFCYANVPYRIADFDSLLRDSKSTVSFDHDEAERIAARCARMGQDGKLVPGAGETVHLVGLAEKLLVPLLAKLGNLVPGGGIWMNAQRPEWNDANNALVGSGLSMVTLYYMRRYVAFLQTLLRGGDTHFFVTAQVAVWLQDTARALIDAQQAMQAGHWTAARAKALFEALGRGSSAYRQTIYAAGSLADPCEVSCDEIQAMLAASLVVLDQSIRENRCDDGLYHAYNLLLSAQGELEIGHLYPMLEGQVAVLSSGVLSAAESAELVDTLFRSDLYREDQRSFMLYPDSPLPSFLEKNRIPASAIEALPCLKALIARGDTRLVLQDADGQYRFAARFNNAKAMKPVLAEIAELDAAERAQIEALYEDVFEHKRFTGRSGTMFAYEGRGSIYWHMVSKLLLAVQEAYFAARARGEHADVVARLGRLYYRVRDGLGFNKTPAEYGAFPCDPYSHTPGHAGAQQPGMTGQVKEEVITRQGELGLMVEDGSILVSPALLDETEFLAADQTYTYLGVGEQWQTLALKAGELAFSWYQVPFVMRRDAALSAVRITLVEASGQRRVLAGTRIPPADAQALFGHTGAIQRVDIELPAVR